MRKAAYAAAIAAGVLLIAILVDRQLPLATASQFKADNTVDVRALEATIDMTSLPRQDTRSEADE
jgi:hypothetical protein